MKSKMTRGQKLQDHKQYKTKYIKQPQRVTKWQPPPPQKKKKNYNLKNAKQLCKTWGIYLHKPENNHKQVQHNKKVKRKPQ